MPSFNNHNRNLTWPSNVYVCHKLLETSAVKPAQGNNALPAIDEDPYAHFISPLSEEDDPSDELSLSAGIVEPETIITVNSKNFKRRASVESKWACYVRRHSELPDDADDLEGDDPLRANSPDMDPIPLLDSDSDEPLSPPDSPKEPIISPSPYKLILREPTLGAAQDVLTPPAWCSFPMLRHGSPRRRTSRTLSGLRHSWRAPSLDLFTVLEEAEPNIDGHSHSGAPIISRRLYMVPTTEDGAGPRSVATAELTTAAARQRCPWRSQL